MVTDSVNAIDVSYEFERDILFIDLVIQNEAKDLVVATHGRSIYKANIAPLQQFNKVKEQEYAIFKIPSVRYSSRWGSSWSQWYDINLPSVTIPFYVLNEGNHKIIISTEDNIELNQLDVKATKGFNFVEYDLSVVEKMTRDMIRYPKEYKDKWATDYFV